ncbi:MAG: hypothetical protein ACOZE5_09205 [Verrucomicrobiota bacterium]
MNPLSEKIHCGTLGELLVQIRLFQHGVQAAPPIKDSGNDLIAIRGESFRAVQVKTRKDEPFTLGPLPPLYHVVALVHLVGEDEEVHLDASRVFLIPREAFEGRAIRYFDDVAEFALRRDLVERLFY